MGSTKYSESSSSTNYNNFLDTVRDGLLNIYRNKGESKESVHAINMLTKEYYRQLQNTPFYWNDLKPLITDAAECDHYHAYTLTDNDVMKFSVHVMPKGTEIPMHAHPGKFSLIMVEYGSLKIEQDSLGKKWLPSSDNNVARLMNRGDTSVGLPVRNNMHQLKALSDVAVFISLRVCSQEKENTNIVTQLFSKRYMAPAYL